MLADTLYDEHICKWRPERDCTDVYICSRQWNHSCREASLFNNACQQFHA